MGQKILIVDGLNTFIRNWAVNPTMNTNGDHVGGTVGFLRSIKSLVREVQPTQVVICWDGKGGSAKRRGIYSEYKAGRKPRVNRQYDFGDDVDASKANLQLQYSKAKQYVGHLGLVQIEVEGCEADDVIGFICRGIYEDTDKVVVSTDKDFLQLVDAHTLVYSPTKKMYYTTDEVKKGFGVLAENFIYLKAFTGDASDNISGIKGLGQKTVTKFFPILGERATDLAELHKLAQSLAPKTVHEKAIVKELLDSWTVIIENVKLMQLTSPIISPNTVRAIRYALEQRAVALNSSAMKLALLRDGLQLVDQDFFAVFNGYRMRAEKEGTPNV